MLGEIRIKYAQEIVEEFKVLDIPLSRFFSSWFKLHPKAGSRDRRILNDLVYSYYRFYFLLIGIETREKLITSYFLMGHSEPGILNLIGIEPGETFNFEKRKEILKTIFPNLDYGTIFPWKELVSNSLNFVDIEYSLINQPRLFIRVQDITKLEKLKKDLAQKGVLYEALTKNAWAFDNRTNLNGIKIGELKSSFEIQDFNSQKTGEFFLAKPRSNWWDCCAGGGGKSLLLASLYPGTNLWSSDSRFSVITNLEARFAMSGFPTPRTFVLDLLAEENPPLREGFFDGIILDAPCSGSGTWARTPERLGNFHPSSLGRICDIQRRIGDKVIPYLNPGGYLIYITCSIFKSENEGIVKYLQERYSLTLENQHYLDGSKIGADTLFVARLKKES